MKYIDKANAAAEAMALRWPTRVITRHAVQLVLAIALHESAAGEDSKLPGNWGCIQRRALTPDEKALARAGKLPSPRDAHEQIHGDTSPTAGAYLVWFWRDVKPDGSSDDVAACGRLLEDLDRLRGIHDLDTVPPAGLAAEMYDRHFYEGFHANDRAANIADYAKAIGRQWATLEAELGNWQPLGPARPAQPPPVPPKSDDEDLQREAAAALLRPFAGRHYPEAEYLDLIAPNDIEGPSLRYLMGHMWSCALTVLGWFRLLCLYDHVIRIAYIVSRAMADVQTVAFAHGAWRPWRAGVEKFAKADNVMIDGGFHVLTVTSDLRPHPLGLVFDTVEGGQVVAGQKGILAMQRVLRPDGTLTSPDGTAHHTVYGYVSFPSLGAKPYVAPEQPKAEPSPSAPSSSTSPATPSAATQVAEQATPVLTTVQTFQGFARGIPALARAVHYVLAAGAAGAATVGAFAAGHPVVTGLVIAGGVVLFVALFAVHRKDRPSE